MNVARAILSALVLLAISIGGIMLGDQATDPAVVAGGVGTIIAAALLGLTSLAVRWRRGTGGYARTSMSVERTARVEDIAAAYGAGVPAVELPVAELPVDDSAVV